MGKYGLTIDNLLAVEVVTAAGEIVTTSADENQDLFWALHGGGNFGVATSFEYQAHPLSTVYGGMVAHPITGRGRRSPPTASSPRRHPTNSPCTSTSSPTRPRQKRNSPP